LLIWLAYVSIPVTLVWFTRRRSDVPFPWMFWMFGAFIIGCGTTHLMEVVTSVTPVYRLSGVVKLLTAGVSLATAVALVPLVPKALSLRSPRELEREVEQRRKAEAVLAQQAASLHEQADLLKKANAAKDTFLASMSHELRTPLNAIIGFTGTLLMRLPGPLTADQEKQLQTVQAGGQHLLALINDLLDLAKIESGKVEPRLEPVTLQDVVREVARTLQPLAQQKGLHLETAAGVPDLVVRTDGRMLTQILLNLANNAIKFTDDGSVRIEVVRHPDGGQSQPAIRVVDTGIGIPPEDHAELFQAFRRVGNAVRRREGTGLGLHLSRKLAELLGATITVHSECGKGTTFTLAWADAGVSPAARADKA
jgi:signal transduction histidine kinase